MNRELAKKIMRGIDDLNAPLDHLDILSLDIEDEAERVEFRRVLAAALVAIGYDLVAHVCKQYPDLDPDKLK